MKVRVPKGQPLEVYVRDWVTEGVPIEYVIDKVEVIISVTAQGISYYDEYTLREHAV